MPSNIFVNYAKYYEAINKNKPYKDEIEFVYNWAKKPKMILDIGCGTASYWKYFPKRARLTGVERSPYMKAQSKYQNFIINRKIQDVQFGVEYDCATALFDVLNYIPKHNWWKKLPIKKGGHFIFDIWDKDKIDRDGFKETRRDGRIIMPDREGNKVSLHIVVNLDDETVYEKHIMYLFSDADIIKFAGKDFEITDKKETDTWQTWYRLKRL